MGIEAFGVKILYSNTKTITEVKRWIQDFPHVRLCATDPEGGTFEFDDGTHLIELQVTEQPNSSFAISIRFSLCNVDSVAPAFVGLVEKMLSLGWEEVWLMASTGIAKPRYGRGEVNDLLAVLPQEIHLLQAKWQQHFGHRQGPIRVAESFKYVGLTK